MVNSGKSASEDEITEERSHPSKDGYIGVIVVAIVIIGLISIFSLKNDAGTKSSLRSGISSLEKTDGEAAMYTATEPKAEILLMTDRGTYHSEERMNITVMVDVPEGLQNATIHIWGIDSKKGRKLEKTELVGLKPGKTIIPFDYTTPKCYGCSGISEGSYSINVELIGGNETLCNATATVEMAR
ncbi:MAG: hypothetical protein JXB14_02855 [Candidatus Altiarchaeota archaeon]|nr:hypothetical protein [Candidatus Altiarchaeota archaeon]